jgi:hypothetical protein
VQKIGQAFAYVAVVGIIGVLAWAIVRGVEKDPSVVGAFATAAAAAGGLIAQRNFEKRRQLERSHQDQMTPIYEELVEAVKENETRSEAENVAFFRNLSSKLILFGPPAVIKAWVEWRQTPVPEPVEGETIDPSAMFAFERVLLSVRADLGRDNSGLAPGDLLRIYINDFDEALAQWALQQAAPAET